MHVLEPMILDATVNGNVAGLRGTDSDLACPNGVYRTAGTERYVAVSVETAGQWAAVGDILPELAELTGDPALAPLEARIARRRARTGDGRRAVRRDDAFDIAAGSARADVPAYPLLRATDLHRDPQLAARGSSWSSTTRPSVHCRTRAPSPDCPPPRTSLATPAPPSVNTPDEVLSTYLGFTDDEISELAASGALT